MNASEIRGMDAEALADRIGELEEELFRLRLQHQTGQLENPLRLKEVRRDIARCKTIRREMEIRSEGAVR